MTDVLSPRVRLDVLWAVCFFADRQAKSARPIRYGDFTCCQSGFHVDTQWSHEDVQLALREMVGIGHVSKDSEGAYLPTDAGRRWLEAELAVLQSVADAHERAGGAA
jgi:hypothetical protein